MKNIFHQNEMNEVISRINKLSPDSKALWGTMTVDKMFAHCNVTYESVYNDNHPKPNWFQKLMLKWFVKNIVVNEKPYKKNSRTGPQFVITSDKNFEAEKTRLIEYLHKTQQLGESHFDGKESHAFGVLTKEEWNNMFYKHLDHHLSQFGV